MNYVVLYNYEFTRIEPTISNHIYITEPTRTVRQRALGMKVFTDSQEAVAFANKHDGQILIPARIESTIIEEGKK
jgi:hypothetical protein